MAHQKSSSVAGWDDWTTIDEDTETEHTSSNVKHYLLYVQNSVSRNVEKMKELILDLDMD